MPCGFGSLNGLCGFGSSLIYSMCFTTVARDGDWVGSDGSPTSTAVGDKATNIDPSTAADGTLIYFYGANDSTGEFRIRFGTDGQTELENTSLLIYKHGSYKVGMQWDDTNKLYTGNNIDAAEYIATLVGFEHCFRTTVTPKLLQWFTFDTIHPTGENDA